MRCLVLTGLLLLVMSGLRGQELKYLALKDDKSKFPTNGFVIGDVVDSTNADGKLGVVKRGTQIKSEIRMKGGPATAILDYVFNNSQSSGEAVKVTMVLRELTLNGTQTARGYSFTTRAFFKFYVGNIEILELGNTGRVTGPPFPMEELASFVKKSVKSSVQRFDKWWMAHKDDVPLNDQAEMDVIVAKATDKPDRLIFNASVPLTYEDFKGDYANHKGEEAAITASGIGIEYRGAVEHSKRVVHVKLTPVFYPHDSWFRPEGKLPHVLAHEQIHFDITAIKTCEMAAAIRDGTFSKEDYDKQLQALLEQYNQLTKAEEEKYDTETNHGLNREQQADWESRVRARLKEVGCY